MKTKIENGITIISTGDATGGKKNKNGYPGIHKYGRMNQYRAEINYKRKKYLLGYSEDVSELIELRKEAELHVKHGDFIDWYNIMRGKRNDNRSKKRNDSDPHKR